MSEFMVTRDELETVCIETLDMINGLRITINTQAEVLGLHRYILEKFVPKPLLEAATTEYVEARNAAIEAECHQEQAANAPQA